jgi:hypothetical protein
VCLVNGFLRWLLEQTNWVNGGTWKLIGIVDCWILCWFGYCLSLFVWFLSRLISFDFFLYCSALFDSLVCWFDCTSSYCIALGRIQHID